MHPVGACAEAGAVLGSGVLACPRMGAAKESTGLVKDLDYSPWASKVSLSPFVNICPAQD